jgi:hypothetical protein
MLDLAAAKDRIDRVVADHAEVLIDASHRIHGSPELGFEEHHAAELLSQVLEQAGLTVERGAYGLPTAFEAVAGSGGPRIAVLCEYDALPGIGHACGHNVIAAAGRRAPGSPPPRWPRSSAGRVRGARHPGRGGRRRQGPMLDAGPSTASTPR